MKLLPPAPPDPSDRVTTKDGATGACLGWMRDGTLYLLSWSGSRFVQPDQVHMIEKRCPHCGALK